MRGGAIMGYIDGKLKIMGGRYYDDWTGDMVYLKDIEEFSFETMTWSLTGEELLETADYSDRGVAIPISMVP